MSIDYEHKVFYGIELDMDRDAFYNLQDIFPHGEVTVDLIGDFMSGEPVPVAYIRDSVISSEDWKYGIFPIGKQVVAGKDNIVVLVDNLVGVPVKGFPGWFFGSTVR